jgi:hypothetical protein
MYGKLALQGPSKMYFPVSKTPQLFWSSPIGNPGFQRMNPVAMSGSPGKSQLCVKNSGMVNWLSGMVHCYQHLGTTFYLHL